MALGIPKKPQKNIEDILEKTVKRTLDIGETHFMNLFDKDNNPKEIEQEIIRYNISSGIGFDAEICALVEMGKAKKVLNKMHIGKVSYLFAGMQVIFTAKKVPATIRIDGEEKSYEKLLFTVAMNEAYEGGGFKFAPNANGEDNELDLVIADGISQFDFFRIFPYAYKGNHVKFKGVEIYRSKTIEVETSEPFWVHTDGEVIGKSSHVCFNLCKAKLQLLN